MTCHPSLPGRAPGAGFLGLALAASMLAALAACRSEPPGRVFHLRGQVLAVRPETSQIVIRHDDIKGFMPAMTMTFTVRDRRLLDGRVPGDLVSATLVVTDDRSWLSTLEKTGFAEVVHTPPPAPAVPVLALGETVPDAAMVDQDGRPFSLTSLRGQAVALTFVYTTCPLPEFCPLMDRNFKAVQDRLKADPGLRGRAHLVSVSFDPAIDTPPVLKAHAGRMGADPAVWTYLTSDQPTIDRFGGALGLVAVRNAPGPGGFTHNLRTVVIDPEGRLAAAYNGNDWTPDELVTALRNALGAR
jgi:protein SCO1/2